MLGTIDRRRVVEPAGALAAGDAPAVMRQVAELDELAPDYATGAGRTAVAVAAGGIGPGAARRRAGWMIVADPEELCGN
jgi:hypothetical protein